MVPINELYKYDGVRRRAVLKRSPFKLFDPNLNFLSYKFVREAIENTNPHFFMQNIRANFIPDKNDADTLETYRNAMNRGIRALNGFCNSYLPDELKPQFYIYDIQKPFDPIAMMTKAREDMLATRSGMHKQPVLSKLQKKMLAHKKGVHEGMRDPERLLRAYNAVRAWGLGHMVLMLDTSPHLYHSVRHTGQIESWFKDNFGFSRGSEVSDGVYEWNTGSGLKVYGAPDQPIRQRKKIYDARGEMRYGSLLMKMFLNQCYPDDIFDVHAVEFLVGGEQNLNDWLHQFRIIRGSAGLEKIQHVDKPGFKCEKFIIRVPVRVDEHTESEKKPIDFVGEGIQSGTTIRHPFEKYIKVPLEFQLVPSISTNHEEYKQKRFMQVLPLWYPREIYEPILRAKGFK